MYFFLDREGGGRLFEGAFIQGRRSLKNPEFLGGVYSREAFIQGRAFIRCITVQHNKPLPAPNAILNKAMPNV